MFTFNSNFRRKNYIQNDRSPALIRQCLARGDFAAARAEAHSLKGAASNVGATALGRVAAAIESAATDAAFAPELVAPELVNLDLQARRTVKAIAALRCPRKRHRAW